LPDWGKTTLVSAVRKLTGSHRLWHAHCKNQHAGEAFAVSLDLSNFYRFLSWRIRGMRQNAR
jgi:hypothetical protein